MKKFTAAILGSAFLSAVLPAAINLAQQPAQKPAPPAVRAPVSTLMPIEARNAFAKQYCQGCHNDTSKSGNMNLTAIDLAHVDQNPELAEKIIKQMRTGHKPPA